MPHVPQPARRPTPLDLAERALRRPSSTIWLHRVRVASRRFDDALAFYAGTLGLTLQTVGLDPARPTRLRALLVDAEGRDVLELVEADREPAAEPGDEPAGPAAVSQLAFCLPRRSWLLLRARLDAQSYPYRHTGEALTLQDADGLVLRVEPLEEG